MCNFIHSSVDQHLVCFLVLITVNSSAMHRGAHVSFWIRVLSRWVSCFGPAIFPFSCGFMTYRIIPGHCISLCVCSVAQLCRTLFNLWPWDFPGKNTGVGCHFCMSDWVIFLSQGENLGLLHWQTASLPLSPQGSPAFHYLIGNGKINRTKFIGWSVVCY